MAEVEPKTQTQPAPPAPPKPRQGPAKKRKKKILKTIITLIIIAAILGVGGYALYKFLNSGEEEVGEIYSEPAYIGSITSSTSGSGSARAKETAAITLSAGGTVKEVFVASGSIVTEGQPLYSIDSQAAQDAVDAAQKELDSLNEGMARLLEQMEELTITAPFAGSLREVGTFQVDDTVNAGTKIATLVNDRTMKLSLYFSYAYEDSIYVGQKATVTVPAVMAVQEGRVEKINKVKYITPEGGVCFEVVVTFDNPGTLGEKMAASAVITDADGVEIYPYKGEPIAYYEQRDIYAKASGPVTGVGQLLNYASVSAGEALLYLGTDTLDEEIRQQQLKINEATLKVQEAEKAMGNFNAVAPIDGTVLTCTLTEGAEVKSGETVIIISNNTTMLADITVDDKNISFIHPGDMVDLNWNGMSYQGKVTAIDMGNAQSGNGMTRYPITLSIDNFDGSLMEGAYLQYSFITSQSDECVLVPSASVRYFSDMDNNRQTVVFVQRESRPDNVPELKLPEFEPGQERTYPSEEEGFYPVIVETGLANAQVTEITSGIEAGDVVFVNYTVTSGAWG